MRRWGVAEDEGKGKARPSFGTRGGFKIKAPWSWMFVCESRFVVTGTSGQTRWDRLWVSSGVVVGLRRVVVKVWAASMIPPSHRPTRMSAIFLWTGGFAPPAQGDESEQGRNKVTRDRESRGRVGGNSETWRFLSRLLRSTRIISTENTPLPQSGLRAWTGGRPGQVEGCLHWPSMSVSSGSTGRRGSRLVGEAETQCDFFVEPVNTFSCSITGTVVRCLLLRSTASAKYCSRG